MSITLFYNKDQGFNLGSATAINEFQNDVAKQGRYLSLIKRDFNEGWIHFQDQEVDLENTNLTQTLKEIEELLTKSLQSSSMEILMILHKACEYAEEHRVDLEFA